MSESYGVTETPLTQDKLLSGDHPRVELPVTIASGAGELSRGALLGRKTSDGKYAPISPGTSYEEEDRGTGDDSTQNFSGTLLHPGVKPESIKIYAVVVGGATETFTYIGNGKMESDASTPGTGTFDPATGAYDITFNTAPKLDEKVYADYVGALTKHVDEALGTGDDSTTAFRGRLANTKVIKGTVHIKTNDTSPKSLYDDANGNLVGDDGNGTINYDTGEYEIEFTAAPANGKTVAADYCSTDGCDICRAILARDIDATSEDVNTITYVHGVFNPEGVVWPTGTSATQKQEIARDCQERGIYFKFSL